MASELTRAGRVTYALMCETHPSERGAIPGGGGKGLILQVPNAAPGWSLEAALAPRRAGLICQSPRRRMRSHTTRRLKRL